LEIYGVLSICFSGGGGSKKTEDFQMNGKSSKETPTSDQQDIPIACPLEGENGRITEDASSNDQPSKRTKESDGQFKLIYSRREGDQNTENAPLLDQSSKKPPTSDQQLESPTNRLSAVKPQGMKYVIMIVYY